MEEWLEKFAESGFRRSSDIAHDLKTPLNVAVLNLELLRMRMAKLCEGAADDERLAGYMRAVEAELRRMAKIYDAFFVYAAPPRTGEAPEIVEVSARMKGELSKVGFAADDLKATVRLRCHQSRLSEACRLLAEGASKLFVRGSVVISERLAEEKYLLHISGHIVSPDAEIGKIFKFYYTDPSGSPELSFATARLILETYGGTLEAAAEGDRLMVELTLPLGEQ